MGTGGTAAADPSAHPAPDVPTYDPNEDDQLVIENATEGRSSEDRYGILIQNEQAGRPQNDRAIAAAEASRLATGELTQNAKIIAPFYVDTDEEVTLEVKTNSSCYGTMEASGSGSVIEVTGSTLVGPYSDVTETAISCRVE